MEVKITTENLETYKNGDLPLVVDRQHGVALARWSVLSSLNSLRNMMERSLLVSVMLRRTMM